MGTVELMAVAQMGTVELTAATPHVGCTWSATHLRYPSTARSAKRSHDRTQTCAECTAQSRFAGVRSAVMYTKRHAVDGSHARHQQRYPSTAGYCSVDGGALHSVQVHALTQMHTCTYRHIYIHIHKY